ncbi:MAG TPA: Rho termination factor [Alphaproteobacteria bacterium]|nr:Rho termination factor [Alphaproteobacteria bacterium]
MSRQRDVSPEVARFQSLLTRGLSREKAARIVAGETQGEPETYEDWSDEELFAHAAEVGVEGSAGMTREELITALRNR